jgi:O-antigen/teichoic acid export membrane protein
MVRPRIARNAALSALNVAVTGVSLFLLYRFLLKTIGVAELGVWSIVLATTSIGRISQLGISVSVVRLVSREVARGDVEASVGVIHTATVAMAAAAGVAIGVLYPVARWALGVVVPPEMLAQALAVLPWAALSLWVACVCSVVESGLDGFQRVDLRAIATMASMVAYLVGAILLVPRYRLVGLAVAQLGQPVLLFAVTGPMLARQLGPVRLLGASRVSRARLAEMLRYGVHVQGMNVGLMLLEPVAKGFLSRLAGLSLVGWFEMANRMVMQLRALVTAGGEALVPAIAHVGESDRSAAHAVYLEACRAVAIVTLPALAITLVATPLLSEVWIGRYEPFFVAFSYLLATGMFLSLLAVPAWFANLGLGTLRWNTISVAVILLLTVLFSLTLGPWLHGWGVVGGYSVAMLAGHELILVTYHRRERLPIRALVSRDEMPVALGALGFTAVGLAIYYGLRARIGLAPTAGLVLLAAAVTLVPPLWHHPLRRRLAISWPPRPSTR